MLFLFSHQAFKYFQLSKHASNFPPYYLPSFPSVSAAVLTKHFRIGTLPLNYYLFIAIFSQTENKPSAVTYPDRKHIILERIGESY